VSSTGYGEACAGSREIAFVRERPAAAWMRPSSRVVAIVPELSTNHVAGSYTAAA
jgi:hypothetical protein